jgi:acetyl esterase
VHDPAHADDPYCSPLRAKDHSGLPPAFIVTAEFDPLCDDGRNYAAKLEAAGVPVTLSEYKGMIHGFLWMSGVLDQSRAVVDELGERVRGLLA